DEGDLGAAAAQVPGGLLAHLPRAEEEDQAAREAAEDLFGERGGGRGHRGGALPDRRLRPHLPPDVQRLPEDAVEERSRRAELVRDAYLAEDLPLAGDEGVETGRDPEHVQGGGAIVQPVERRLDVRLEGRKRRYGVALRLAGLPGSEM